jgi:hypothetical protein
MLYNEGGGSMARRRRCGEGPSAEALNATLRVFFQEELELGNAEVFPRIG